MEDVLHIHHLHLVKVNGYFLCRKRTAASADTLDLFCKHRKVELGGIVSCKVDLKSGRIMVSAQDLGFSIAAHETIECQYDGEELAIGFKSQFITEVLSNMSCGELVMKFLDSKRAALVVPAETEEESEKLCGIIMPIMIS